MKKREKAGKLNNKALKLQSRGKLEEAIELYLEASAVDPKWSAPPYNLGLLFKRERKWKESLKYNRLATSADPDNQSAWWNMGIAATALGRWQLARSAWRGFGLEVPDGQGPIDFPCGYGPIRLNVDGGAEVVWAYRLDPARAELASIPFPESRHRWRDVVLNDGAPNGYRRYEGVEVPVFDALALLEMSPFGTFVARVRMPRDRKAIVELARIAAELEGSAEDWSTSVRILCRACSEGRPHTDHDSEAAPPKGAHTIGIAARDREHATTILNTWESNREDVEVEWLEDALT
ncbi:MAG TPA: tetratricopeptide repeat protein [Gemmataceae bacterium]|jgi:tetratricopeptide (TPR) repeat protein